ncbi:hypothetical protein BO70DRAFT_359732 [Aspergillus heteromorphus CBS 117.55]|uniref:Mediator of RNA polymerase II transcription subunit 4 n=1 Tax=Aspergillus heteromorphus CBS 117.55 TaxID=1448321 RepID=A0A317WSX1_9EURO|nr:uncharacterized protein BO70DRAFT_359732 [Aspergillus heteromorphus CBS 117.55]PWY88287.1 hypothetical protein BO70DRAFT_359732 [Aspergillus heteromorphus CBS 117.55]
MNTEFQSSLSNLENKLNALIISLTTSPTASGAPAAAVGLLSADDLLTSAVETLRQHQQNYAKILRLREEAQLLEEKVKSIVREVVACEKEIRTTCGDDETDSDEDFDDESSDYDSDEDMEGGKPATRGLRKIKEVDYKLLLDFARRISKYNHQAAADAASNAEAKSREKIQQARGQDTEMTGTNGNTDTETAEPVASVTKEATNWLDESANMTRQAYMLPYPMEDRIRMGLMGQIQLAGGEGRPGFDPEKEVERLIREAEGLGVADAVPPVVVGEETRHADEAAKAAAHAGSAAAGRATMGAAPAPRPKATLDLDLYDPDEDDD